jgi:hypothetical protein
LREEEESYQTWKWHARTYTHTETHESATNSEQAAKNTRFWQYLPIFTRPVSPKLFSPIEPQDRAFSRIAPRTKKKLDCAHTSTGKGAQYDQHQQQWGDKGAHFL